MISHRSFRFGVLSVLFVGVAVCGLAQELRFSTHREVEIPEYATLRIGPFYSTIEFSQTVGYRYTRSSGTGSDYLLEYRRGEIKEDGSDFPLVTGLDFRNYLLITRNADLDISFNASYEYYPLDTQEDQFIVDVVEEGVYGTISAGLRLTPYLRGRLYDSFRYRTDYIDTRGISDVYGGEEYEYFRNEVGTDLDWLLAPEKNMGLSLKRTDNVPRTEEFKDQERVSYDESLLYEQEFYRDVIGGVRADFGQSSYPVTNRADSSFQNYTVYTEARLSEFTHASASIGYWLGRTASANRPEDERDEWDTVTGNLAFDTQLNRYLSHGFGYTRSQTRGFDSAFELLDRYRYELKWGGELSSASMYTQLTDVQPSRTGMSEYADWESGVIFTYPLTRYIALDLSSTYRVRDNKGDNAEEETVDVAPAAEDESVEDDQVFPEPADIETQADYTTWASRIGTTFSLTRSIEFTTYAQHIERFSDASSLEYERDIFVAKFTYTREL